MAWTAPMTAVAGAVYTAAQFNSFVRDNLLETCTGRATSSGNYFVTSGTNRISERTAQQAYVAQQDSQTQTSYADCDGSPSGNPAPGPSATVFTGSQALVVVGGQIGVGSVDTQSVKMSWEVSGDTTISATDLWAAGEVGFNRAGASGGGYVYDSRAWLCTGLTEGLNTFTAKYAVSSGQGFFQYRSLLVMPF